MTVPAVPSVELSDVKGSKGVSATQAANEAMPAAPNKEAEPAHAKDFDQQMGVASAEPAPAGTIHMHRAHETRSLDALVAHVRSETAALDTRYQAAVQQMEHPGSLLDPSDPMMSMVRLTDFTLTTTVTMQQYQFSMTMADASNGVTHSLLKNNAE
ncbi:MAG TPA: hypothetical protein VL635_03285 [Trinickia sp.]|nr:hypothetical protein [Trinickia sp.]